MAKTEKGKKVDVFFEGFENGVFKGLDEQEERRQAWEELITAKDYGRMVEGIVNAMETHPVESEEEEHLFARVNYKGIMGYIAAEDFPVTYNKIEMTKYLGSPAMFKLTEIDQQQGFFVASRKKAIDAIKQHFDKNVQDGNIVNAIVHSVHVKKAIVNVGGYETTLPIKEVKRGWVPDVRNILTKNDIIEVMIQKKNNPGESPIISRKDTLPDPFPECLNRYQSGNDYIGYVTGFAQSGVFVELEDSVSTLTRNISQTNVNVGDQVLVRVTRIAENKKAPKQAPGEQKYQIRSKLIKKTM